MKYFKVEINEFDEDNRTTLIDTKNFSSREVANNWMADNGYIIDNDISDEHIVYYELPNSNIGAVGGYVTFKLEDANIIIQHTTWEILKYSSGSLT